MSLTRPPSPWPDDPRHAILRWCCYVALSGPTIRGSERVRWACSAGQSACTFGTNTGAPWDCRSKTLTATPERERRRDGWTRTRGAAVARREGRGAAPDVLLGTPESS